MLQNQGKKAQVSLSNAFVAFGSNLPAATASPEALVLRALRLLSGDSVSLTAQSRLYRSPAFPEGSGPDYINGVVALRTSLSAQGLLARLHRIEALLGRERKSRWGARSLDLDLLAFDQQILPDLSGYEYWRNLPLEQQMQRAPETLILPHPRLQDRAFVLLPLAEIAPNWLHPVLDESAVSLLARLPEADRQAILPL